MIVKTSGQYVFYYACPKNKIKNKYNFKYLGSLFAILLGIFLLPSTAYFSDISPEKIIQLTNERRELSGINSLTANQLLTSAAYKKAEAIIKEQKFSHNFENKKFSDWVKEAGYKYSYVGENLAIDFVTSEGVLNAWWDSPSHKNNLLNPLYSEIGLAVVEGNFNNQNSILVVEIFGAPPKSVVTPKIFGINNVSFLKNASSLHNSDNLLTNVVSSNYPSMTLPKYSIQKQSTQLSDSSFKQLYFYLNKLFVQADFYKYSNIFLSIFITFIFSLIIYSYIKSFSNINS
jgi:hypothetical protein